MNLFPKRRTSKNSQPARRNAITRARRSGKGALVERLEERALLAVLDIGASPVLPTLAPNQLGWLSAGGVTNDLRISVVPGGNYTFTDPNETIKLGVHAAALGWTGTGTNTVTGPDISVNSILLDGNDNAGAPDSIHIDSNDDPLTIQPNVFGPVIINTPEDVSIGRLPGGLQAIQGTITVKNPNNFTALTIDNSADTTGRTGNLSSTGLTGMSPQPINWVQNDLSSLSIVGGTGGSTYNVSGTPSNSFIPPLLAPVATSITTAAIGDIVNVTGTSATVPGAPLSIIGNGDNTVNVGLGSTQGINGDINISNPPAFTTLVVDDTGDATGRTIGLTTSGVGSGATDGQVTGITASGNINFVPLDVRQITLNAGDGSDTITENLASSFYNLNLGGVAINAGVGDDEVNVQATSAGVTTSIDTQLGTGDHTNIGSAAPDLATSVLSGILGPVNVTDSGGVGAVSVSDQGDVVGQTWNLGATQITGGGLGAPITYDGSAEPLTLSGGSGGNTFVVADTNGGAFTTINSGAGDDSVFVVATTGPLTIDGQDGIDQVTLGSDNTGIGNPGTVQNIIGDVTLRKTGLGSLDATIDDTNNAAAVTANLTFDGSFATLSGQAPAFIDYLASEIGSISILSGGGADSLNVDFSVGNPIPTGPSSSTGGLAYTGQGAGLLNLINDLPSGPFQDETSTASGPGTGTIDLVDSALSFSHISYTALSPVDDTTSAVNYTFSSPLFTGQSVQVQDTTVNGFSGTRILENTGAFERQDIANKQNVTIEVGSSFAIVPVDESVTINNPGAAAGAHNLALASMTVSTFAGSDDINVVAVPAIPNVFVNTGDGNDTANVVGAGVPVGTTLNLDGGPGGSDLLNYNASGAAVTVSAGALPGEVVITGPNGTVDAVNFEAVVISNQAPTPPVLNPTPLTINTVQGTQLVNVVVGTFTSAAPGAKASDFAATIAWGDGSPATGGVIVQDGANPKLFYVFGSHTFAVKGAFTIATTVSSPGGTNTTIVNGTPVTTVTPPSGPVGPTTTANVTVDNAPLTLTANPISAIEGSTSTPTVLATFIDQGFDPSNPTPLAQYSATVNWGDGTATVALPPGAITQLGNAGEFQISGTHVYPHAGTFVVTITLTNADPVVVVATAPAFVADATPAAVTPVAVSATEGTAVTGSLLTFTDPGTAGDFTATIDWGDGTIGLGTVTGAGTFTVAGTHTYTEEGSYKVVVVVNDVGGQSLVASSTATVADALLTVAPSAAVAATEGLSFTGPVGAFTDANSFATVGDFTATIAWGDGATSTGTVMQTGSGAFAVSGTHTYAEETTGVPEAITFTVHDDGGSSLTAAVGSLATVADAALTAQGATVTGTEGTALAPQVVASFTDANLKAPLSDFTATINWGDGTAVVTLPAGAVTQPGGVGTPLLVTAGVHTYAEEGTFATTVTITDVGGSKAVAHGQATIVDATPAAVTPVAVSATEGTAVTGSLLTFTDPGTASDFTATIDWGDGTIGLGTVTGAGTFTVAGTHTYTEEGSYKVSIAVNDVGGQMVTAGTTATVADALLTVAPSAAVAATEGLSFTGPVGAFTDANSFATVGDFTATIAWGDGATSTGTVMQTGSGAFAVSGTHTYAEETTGVPEAITFTVHDDGGSSLTAAVGSLATVADAALTAQGATVTGTEGTALAPQVVASFTDANLKAPLSDFTATIDWGDGTAVVTLPAGAVTQPGGVGTPLLVTAGVHTYAEEGTFATTVTITDVGGSKAVAHGQATIVDATPAAVTPVAVSATEGTAVTGSLLTFTDPGTASDFTATIDWGDGTIGLGTVTGAGTFTVAGTHTYTEEGSYKVIVVVNDVGGQSVTGSTTATVADAALTASPAPVMTVSAVEGQALNDLALGTFIDANKFATPGDFTVSINWGDGTTAAPDIDTSTGAVTLVGGTAAGAKFRVSGSHSFAEEGTFPITITVTDVGGQSTTIGTTATVADAPLTASGASITGVEGAATGSVLIASFTDADPAGAVGDYTVKVNWGDGTAVETLPAAALSSIGSANGVTFQVTAAHTYAEEGVYQTTITIADAGGSQAIAHGSAKIADAALTDTSTPFSATEATKYSGPVASFSDANAGAPASDFKATIDWGDGTPNTLGTVVATGAGTFNVLGTHIYKDAGVNGGVGTFPVTVHVIDDGGSTITLNNTANVADRVLTVSGFLSRASDSGQSYVDAITNVVNPKFFGLTSEPNSLVFLYSQPSGGGAMTLIGQGVSDASHLWKITSGHLNDGSYNIFVQALDSDRNTLSALTPVLPNANQGPLVIDTVGPKVTNTLFSRLNGQVLVTFQDDRSGLNQSSLVDAANYSFNKILTRPIGTYQVNNLAASPQGPSATSPELVTVTINQGRQIRGGYYLFTVKSASALLKSGVRDVAGNALDGEFYGFFPSGNNVRGGDFVAELDAVHNKIYPARTVVGNATPVVPPGTPAVGINLKTGLPFTPAQIQRQRIRAVDAALATLKAARVRPNQK